MGPGRRRLLVAVAVLLPALLVYGARQIGSPVAASDMPVDIPPVFVGRLTPASTHCPPGQPLRVTVEIRADRTLDLAGIRVAVEGGEPAELAPFPVGPEPRTVPFEVVFPDRGDRSLVLQVRLTPDGSWTDLPPTAEILVA
jgi:hypothetical protein